MENFDTTPSVETNDSGWQTLEKQAVAQANEMMRGLEDRALAEKIVVLRDLLEELKSDNKNRFVYREISLILEECLLDKRYEEEKGHFRKIRTAREMV